MHKFLKKLAIFNIGLFYLIITALLGPPPQAHASSISSNNASGLTITISPNADRGVEISSGNVTLNLGTVDMNTSTQTVQPATITIVGNMDATELAVKGEITGGATPWTFDSTPASAESDKLGAMVLFSSVDQASAPASGDFDTTIDTISTNNANVGDSNVLTRGLSPGSGNYEGAWVTSGANTDNNSDMDGLSANRKRHVWVRLTTPSSTSISDQQSVVITFTAQGPQ